MPGHPPGTKNPYRSIRLSLAVLQVRRSTLQTVEGGIQWRMTQSWFQRSSEHALRSCLSCSSTLSKSQSCKGARQHESLRFGIDLEHVMDPLFLNDDVHNWRRDQGFPCKGLCRSNPIRQAQSPAVTNMHSCNRNPTPLGCRLNRLAEAVTNMRFS